jgi:hypothetical protein
MPSSISCSEDVALLERDVPGARAPLEAPRETAADRPGEAQPVPVRPIPPQPWGRILLAATLLFAAALGAWERAMRREQLLPADYSLDPSGWAAKRRLVDAGQAAVVIVGDSRILFDTDLARFEALTGVRPVQLALPGSSGLCMLEDLAADPDFRGVAIVGVADMIYFRPGPGGLVVDALKRYHDEGPSQRSGHALGRALESQLGFIDPAYRLSRLLADADRGWREGARSGYYRPWKVFEVDADGQVALWPRIETDERVRAQVQAGWMGPPDRPARTLPPAAIADGIERSRKAVAAIRARGGDVVLVRPPSSGPLLDRESSVLPRSRGWDPLLAATGVSGVHFADHADLRVLPVPEWSHLNRRCATVFTDVYVRALAASTKALPLRADAPAPLTARACMPRSTAG